MTRTRTLVIGAALAAGLSVSAAQAPRAPTFKVDPFWPKPLQNHWILGSITGIAVDAKDHLWVVHRGAASLNARTEIGLAASPPSAESCCLPAPVVLRFDPSGAVVSSWTKLDDRAQWPQSPGGLTVDPAGHVWVAASGPADPMPGARGRGNAAAPPPADAHVLKFSPDGRLLLQIGKAGQTGDSNSTPAMHRPTAVEVDATANEVYVADGVVNRRIVVFDAGTGAYKRHWGAYGAKPDDAPVSPYDPAAPASKQFSVPSCVKLSKDGLVYVCDRRNNRIQVFRKDGTFVKEGVVAKETRGEGAVWSLAFSNDPQQRLVYVADGSNQTIWILQRDTLSSVSNFGAGGRWPGHFYGVGSIAIDSRGNVYTGETYEGKRVQKFSPSSGSGNSEASR